MAKVFRFLLGCMLVIGLAVSAQAATVVVLEPESASRAGRILIEGEIQAGDEILFSNAALHLSRAIVILSIEGGDLPTMLQIGDTIQLKKFDTLVVEDFDCPATCAFGWLAGRSHFMQSGSRISFYGTPTDAESGPLIETYLAKLQTPNTVADYISRSTQDADSWLTAEQAQIKSFSIDLMDEVLLLEPDISNVEAEPEPPPKPVPPPKPKPTPAPIPQKRFQTVAGLDLFGYDLPGMPLREATWESCSIECTSLKNCNAFTYNSKSRTCFLKSHADFAVHYEPASSGVIPKLVRGIRQSTIQVLQRIDIVGNDFNNTEGGTLEDCLRSCDSDTSCAGFSFVTKKNQCWMKSAVGETIAKQGVVSGVK